MGSLVLLSAVILFSGTYLCQAETSTTAETTVSEELTTSVSLATGSAGTTATEQQSNTASQATGANDSVTTSPISKNGETPVSGATLPGEQTVTTSMNTGTTVTEPMASTVTASKNTGTTVTEPMASTVTASKNTETPVSGATESTQQSTTTMSEATGTTTEMLTTTPDPELALDVECDNSNDNALTVTWTYTGKEAESFIVTVDGEDKPGIPVTSTLTDTLTVTPGAKYDITVKSVKGTTSLVETPKKQCIAKPSQPTQVTLEAQATAGDVKVNWVPGVGGVEKFIVRTYLPQSQVAETSVTALADQSAAIINTTVGVTYTISVTADTGGTESTPATTTYKSNPLSPVDVQVQMIRYDAVSIRWKHGGGLVDKFTVNVNDVPLDYTADTYDSTTVLEQNRTVSPGNVYSIAVTSIKDELKGMTELQYKAGPSPPISLTVSSSDNGNIVVTWEDGDGPSPYNFIYNILIGNRNESKVVNWESNQTTVNINVDPGSECELSVGANISDIFTFAEKKTFRAPVKCYSCSDSIPCRSIQSPNSPTAICNIDQFCWIRHSLSNGLSQYTRGCESTTCSTEFQTSKCVTEGTKITCSKCCTGDGCNTEIVYNGSRSMVSGLSLLTASLLILVSTIVAAI